MPLTKQARSSPSTVSTVCIATVTSTSVTSALGLCVRSPADGRESVTLRSRAELWSPQAYGGASVHYRAADDPSALANGAVVRRPGTSRLFPPVPHVIRMRHTSASQEPE